MRRRSLTDSEDPKVKTQVRLGAALQRILTPDFGAYTLRTIFTDNAALRYVTRYYGDGYLIITYSMSHLEKEMAFPIFPIPLYKLPFVTASVVPKSEKTRPRKTTHDWVVSSSQSQKIVEVVCVCGQRRQATDGVDPTHPAITEAEV